MLQPDDRRSLLEALRPPEGYRIDYAVGTTFTLDLLALLLTPTAFTLFDMEAAGNDRLPDPTALLGAVRDYADRMIIFCEAGRIAVPSRFRTLFGYLEGSVCQVVAPQEGRAFHPKVWVLRYTSKDGPVLYRLLVQSRNLTFDRSWDVMLVLDGELVVRQNAFASNHPLGDFIDVLADMGTSLTQEQRAALELMQDEVRRVRFVLPEGFDDLKFRPLGIPGHRRWPFAGRVDRMLIVSPFLKDGCLRRLTAQGQGHVLVSRPDSLAGLDAETMRAFEEVAVLSDIVEAEPSDDDFDMVPEDTQGEMVDTNGRGPLDDRRLAKEIGARFGLHAKLFVADAGGKARLWVGSANATDAAFSGNVEFLVELQGSRRLCGVDALLGYGRGGIGDLLQSFTVQDGDVQDDGLERQLEERLDSVRRTLATAPFVAQVEQTGEDMYTLALCVRSDENFAFPDNVDIRCRPLSLAVAQSLARLGPVAEDGRASGRRGTRRLMSFEHIAFESITSFFAFSVTVRQEGRMLEETFVLNVPLEGAPDNRRERLLSYTLGDQRQFIRLLLMMLAESGLDAYETLDWLRRSEAFGGDGQTGEVQVPLLEALLRTLDRDPKNLDRVARLVDDLRRTPEGERILPAGFDAIWRPIWRVRQEVKRR